MNNEKAKTHEFIVENFHKTIDNLVRLNTQNRVVADRHKRALSPNFWAMKFCTVRCDIGRGTGKTEYIKRRATKSDLVIVFNDEACSRIASEISCPIIIANQLERKIMRMENRFNTIFIDEPELIFREISQQRLYALLVYDYYHTFILLGS